MKRCGLQDRQSHWMTNTVALIKNKNGVFFSSRGQQLPVTYVPLQSA
jgi:hypothetical protein